MLTAVQGYLAASGWACAILLLGVALRLFRKLEATEALLDDALRFYFELLSQYCLLKGTSPGSRRKHLHLIKGDGDR